LLVVTTGVLLFLIFSEQNKTPQSTSVGDIQIPNLALRNYEGDIHDFSQIQGKPAVYILWASWCAVCKDQLLAAAQIQQEYQGQVTFVAVNRTDSPKEAKEFTDALKITDKLLFILDPNDDFYRNIGGTNIPETLFVDAQETVRAYSKAPMNARQIREQLQLIL
jgi:thiol-disulfide isomerase/thioredoxin